MKRKFRSIWDRPDLLRRLCASALVSVGLFGVTFHWTVEVEAQSGDMLIDDFSLQDFYSKLGTQWRGVSDKVMGGISEAYVTNDVMDGRRCLRLSGAVHLENNGGFIQAVLDLAPSGATLNASDYTGVRLIARGNGELYSVHLRTADNVRPWQSYRANFTAGPDWETVDLPFASFTPYRLETPFNVALLRRIGLVAIGRAFHADLAVAQVDLYR
jgi:hypothetical protein